MSFYFSIKELRKDETKKKWFVRLKELADVNPDPKLARTVLLAFKDYDEGRIDKERLKRCVQEFSQSANRVLSSQEFMEKYPVFNPLKKKIKRK